MSEQHDVPENPGQIQNQFKVTDPDQRTSIVEAAVRAVIENISEIDRNRQEAAKLELGQLAVLHGALKDYPEPVTEEVWESIFKSKVTALLDEAASKGSSRYANTASRDVMVNLFKIATMGLTLAKQEPDFAPTPATATNLKKYATVVRPLLQRAIDPATGKPRLRSIAASAKSRSGPRLAEGAYYWLIGCEDAELGIAGPNAVLGADRDLRKLEEIASSVASKYRSFLYCEAKMEPLTLRRSTPVKLMISNSAVISGTVSSIVL